MYESKTAGRGLFLLLGLSDSFGVGRNYML